MTMCTNCSKNCESVIKSVGNAWICKQFKIWLYGELPEGMRPAVKDDIFPPGRFIIGKSYLLFSNYSKVYESYTTSDNTDILMLSQFIADEKCWVKM